MESNYEKLVKALRCRIPNPPEACEGCTYNMGGMCYTTRMMADAAAAIEALQAELDKYHELCDVDEIPEVLEILMTV